MACFRFNDLDETGDLVVGCAATLETLHLKSTDSDGLWIHVYDAATAGAVNEGTDPPVASFWLPAGGSETWTLLEPFSRGIVVAAFQEWSGAPTGPGANEVRGTAIYR